MYLDGTWEFRKNSRSECLDLSLESVVSVKLQHDLQDKYYILLPKYLTLTLNDVEGKNNWK